MSSDDETTPIVPENDKKGSCHGNCRPESNCFRYTLMVVICIVSMGDFFGGGTPYALEDHILTVIGITESKFMLFASCLQWVQTGVALLGGYLIDKVFGIRFSVVLAAVAMAVAQVSDFFGGDIPYALEDHILTVLDITESKFMLLASCIQWVQICVVLIGGYFVDRVFGIRLSVVLAALAVTAAQGVFSWAAMIKSFWTMIAARTVFGAFIGLEWISISKMTTKWFKDKELTFVTALKMSLGRLGTVLTLNMMDPIYSAFNVHYSNLESLGLAMFVGAACCLLSAIFSFWYFYMDKHAEAQNFPPAPEAPTGSGDVVIHVPRKLRVFSLQFWLLTMMVVFNSLILPTFSGLGQVFFERKYGSSLDSATLLNSLQYIIGAIAMPPIGIVIDRVGRNLYWIIAGSLLQTGGLLLLTTTLINPYIPMTLVGGSYVLTSLATWPLFSYVVQMDYLGTAFGIIRTGLCLTLAISTYVAGYLTEYCGYVFMELLLLMFSCVAMIFGTLVFVVDKAQAGNLNLGPTARLLHEETRNVM